jgi:hypothetical protein
MIERNLKAVLLQRASSMPVVAVTGPRQSGKTTLCRTTFPDKPYVSLEALDVRQYARQDPRGFLKEFAGGAVFDEVQQAPELFSYLQPDVDEDPRPGRFILTGSQHFGVTESISQTLVGRIALLYLLPPSFDELGRFESAPTDLLNVLWAGAYPRIFDRGLDPGQWLADYAATYLQRDVRQVLNVTDLDAFSVFLRLAAGRTANELNLSALGDDAGVTHNTARAWLSVLEASFICLRLPAWHRNLRKQAIKAPKIHFLDTGLACHLLGIREPEQLRHHPLRGSIFESWVVAEVYKSRLHRGLPADLFHFRDTKGREVDLVHEQGDRIVAVEAKSAATVSSDFFTALQWLGNLVAGRLPHVDYEARVIYGGQEGQRRTAATVIPWAEIHEHPW